MVVEYCRSEWALEVEDVMVRRTRWHYYRDDREAVAERVAGWMQEVLGWSDAERVASSERYLELCRRSFGE